MAFADSVAVCVPCHTLSGFSVEALSSSLSRLWCTMLGELVFNWTPRFPHYAKSRSPSGISRSSRISRPEKSPLTSDRSWLLTEFSLRRETQHPFIAKGVRRLTIDIGCPKAVDLDFVRNLFAKFSINFFLKFHVTMLVTIGKQILIA